MLIVIMMSGIALSGCTRYCYAECHHANCHIGEYFMNFCAEGHPVESYYTE